MLDHDFISNSIRAVRGYFLIFLFFFFPFLFATNFSRISSKDNPASAIVALQQTGLRLLVWSQAQELPLANPPK